MKRYIFITLLLFPFSIFAQQMNIISYNIRYATENDRFNNWPERVDMVNGLFKFHDPDIFGLQEALYKQIKDIENELPEFEWIGVGRDDGEKEGEFSPIFYNKNEFILIKNGHFWLSENCDEPGLGWDAACNRIVTWGKFQSKVTGKRFFVFNTHFDHRGVEARKNSANLIRDKVKELIGESNLPVILTGDFNLTPEQEPIRMLKKHFKDSRDITEEPPYGPVGTFSGFKVTADLDRRIDYVFVQGEIKVIEYAVLTDNKDKRTPSDHLPVFVRVQLN